MAQFPTPLRAALACDDSLHSILRYDDYPSQKLVGVAAGKASTKWLEQFTRHYLALLEKGQITPHELASELEEEFVSRMLNTLAKQKKVLLKL